MTCAGCPSGSSGGGGVSTTCSCSSGYYYGGGTGGNACRPCFNVIFFSPYLMLFYVSVSILHCMSKWVQRWGGSIYHMLLSCWLLLRWRHWRYALSDFGSTKRLMSVLVRLASLLCYACGSYMTSAGGTSTTCYCVSGAHIT